MRKKGPGLDWAKGDERDKKKKMVAPRKDLIIIFKFKAHFLYAMALKPLLIIEGSGVSLRLNEDLDRVFPLYD